MSELQYNKAPECYIIDHIVKYLHVVAPYVRLLDLCTFEAENNNCTEAAEAKQNNTHP